MFTTLLATHHGWDGPGLWILVPILFWLTIVALVVWGFRRAGSPPWARHAGRSVLDERYARGEISAEEYRERRNVMQEVDR
ncbi:MAG TPA: SHOCT domain-containing protein [Acidimicrobiales bacterium]|nr:SHOCT domain-containing protein [Acidimicrobiales bacterium]